MSCLKLAIVQFPRDHKDLEKNVVRMKEYISQIPPAIDVVLLPEDWLGATVVDWGNYEKIVSSLYDMLKNKSCLLVSGAQYVRTKERIYSRGLALTGQPDSLVYFEKQFPSSAIGERKYVSPGTQLP
ncbi:MAG: hypothetical protein ACPLRU_06615, partial [Desulfofundulus sp.]